MSSLRDELKDLYLELGIFEKYPCSKEENKQFGELANNREQLPDGVHQANDGSFYRFVKTDMSKEEIEELLLCRQICYLKTIKTAVIFLAALPIVGLFLGWLIASIV